MSLHDVYQKLEYTLLIILYLALSLLEIHKNQMCPIFLYIVSIHLNYLKDARGLSFVYIKFQLNLPFRLILCK